MDKSGNSSTSKEVQETEGETEHLPVDAPAVAEHSVLDVEPVSPSKDVRNGSPPRSPFNDGSSHNEDESGEDSDEDGDVEEDDDDEFNAAATQEVDFYVDWSPEQMLNHLRSGNPHYAIHFFLAI